MPVADEKTLSFYGALMNEVKVRLRFIDTLHHGKYKDEIPAQLAREICFLQLRMSFEVIAIAILGLHRGHFNLETLEREWSARKIMPALEKLNENYFPHAVTVQAGHIDDIEPHPLDKKEFLSLYGRCGDEVHRGHWRKVSGTDTSVPIKFSDVAEINQKIWNLLNKHRISSSDLMVHYLCFLEFEGTDKSAVFIMNTDQITFLS